MNRSPVFNPDGATVFVDQYGGKVYATTVAGLREAAGGGRVSPMYQDKRDGRTVQTGYVVGARWFTAYWPREVAA